MPFVGVQVSLQSFETLTSGFLGPNFVLVGPESDGRFVCFWMQIYTDWANHYLAKSGHKRLIKDLQTDVTDGVLLAEIIQVVANEKIDDINGCPKSRSQMVSDLQTLFSLQKHKILPSIYGLFFSANISVHLNEDKTLTSNFSGTYGLFCSMNLPGIIGSLAVISAASSALKETRRHEGQVQPQSLCKYLLCVCSSVKTNTLRFVEFV
uniref:Calponin-homology (CH) domain-containing protein n=1 Tax=Poecilia mexicana TaxID=48701 RepID=A0A3B3XBC0_9TELE